jgi:precorrin-3B methylase
MPNHGRMTAQDALTESTILCAQKKYLKRVKKEEQTMKKLKPKRSIGWRIRGL